MASILFDHYARIYLDFKRHELKASTLEKYEKIVTNRLLPVFAGKPVDEIRPSDVKRWLYSLVDIGGKSKRHYLGVLSGILQEALFDEVIEKNPVKFVRLPKVQKPVIRPFTSDQVKAILDDAENFNYRHFLAIAFFTGMRSGEIIALKRQDIDLERCVIHVERSRSKHGETTPKTLTSIRDVPILDVLRPYLDHLLQENGSEYLFINQYGEPYRDTHCFIYNHWRPALERLGIEYRRLYNTRHTFATNMLYRNLVSPVQLAQILGHANTQMVYDVYVSYVTQWYRDFDRSIKIYV